jgi:hypothetical protein
LNSIHIAGQKYGSRAIAMLAPLYVLVFTPNHLYHGAFFIIHHFIQQNKIQKLYLIFVVSEKTTPKGPKLLFIGKSVSCQQRCDRNLVYY